MQAPSMARAATGARLGGGGEMILMRIAARILRPIVVRILSDEEQRHRAKMRAAADRISAELDLEDRPNSLAQLALTLLRGDSQ